MSITCANVVIGYLVFVFVLYTLSRRPSSPSRSSLVEAFTTSAQSLLSVNGNGDLLTLPSTYVDSHTPLGTMTMYMGTVEPKEQGWYFCNGQTLTIPDHTTLTAFTSVMGSTVTSTSTTVTLPDLRGRFVVGQTHNQKIDNIEYKLGDTGGENMHQLSTAEMPTHSHGATMDDQLDFSLTRGANDNRNWDNWMDQGAGAHRQTINFKHKHNITVQDTGGNQTHENRPPFVAISYLIKVKHT